MSRRLFCPLVILTCLLSPASLLADDASHLAYLDESNPWYPHQDLPKLITPQWVGEDGVDAVVTLAIDDMRDTAKYEQYLRPILNRLKRIDGRAPVSIMTCEVSPDDPQLQSWLEEGLSIEVHTVDHPCPILQGSLEQAKSTYDRCVDLLSTIPGNKPVAFRTPCCDSLNTVSPRFYSAIFSNTTPQGNYLQIDSSVFNFFTSDDESIPRELVLDKDGNERFWKYKPTNNPYRDTPNDNFVNYITNYPYPYLIDKTCWQFPCVAPSDWSAQHLHGVNNPQTVDDWKAALDITVHKQGVFNLVFHPHGWITAEQIVELIDHAVEKHGSRVKFLTFREAADRLNRSLTDGHSVRNADSAKLNQLTYAEARRQAPGPREFRSLTADLQQALQAAAAAETVPPLITKTETGKPISNGVLLADDHVCWQNENTAQLPDMLQRVPFAELLAAAAKAETDETPLRSVPGGRQGQPSVPEGRLHVAPGVNPGIDGQKDVEAPQGRQVRSTGAAAAPAGLPNLAASTPGSRPGLHPAVPSALNTDDDQATRLSAIPEGRQDGNRRTDEPSVPEGRKHVAPGVNPGIDGKKDVEAPQGRQVRSTGAAAAPAGLAPNLAASTPGSRPGLNPAVPSALNTFIRVGAASIDITPDYPVRLSGYGNRDKESAGVATRIHARALAIGGDAPRSEAAPEQNPEASQTALTVLITVDNCGVPDEVTDEVFEKLAAKHGLARARFAISSTHTHSGPWLRDFAPLILTSLPDDQIQRLEKYESELVDKLVEVVGTAIQNRRPGRLSYGHGQVGFAKNRRALKEGQWVGFGEADEGPVDRRLPVLAAHDADGQLIAVLASYACHATTETGEFNQISGDWPGFAADMIEADHPGAVALIAIGTGADANPSPRGTHEQARLHGRELADEVQRLLATADVTSPPGSQDAEPAAQSADGEQLTPVSPSIACNFARIDLPLGPLPSRQEWEERATQDGPVGAHARYFLNMLDAGQEIPATVPGYPVQTWCFGNDLAMVFLGGEVVVDYAIRLNQMFDDERLWINAYSNDVPCYIASKRILREGGYEADSSMRYYAKPTRLSPDAEDLICDTVQKLLPQQFYSEELQVDFPAPKSPEDSLAAMTTKPGFKIEVVAAEPLINDPVAFDWDVQGRLWVVEMGDYPQGVPAESGAETHNVGTADAAVSQPVSRQNFETRGRGGRIRVLTDVDGDGDYDKATTFMDGLPFPTGICLWRDGVIITAAPDVIFAQDTDGDGRADRRQTLYTGFGEGNQQHRVNGLRWGLDGWLYLGNGDSDGEIRSTGFRIQDPRFSETKSTDAVSAESDSVSVSGRDIRIQPDTGAIDTVSGRTQYGRERDDFGNWFGNNNSNPIWHYGLEDRYLRRNPHATVASTRIEIAETPGAAPVYPTSRTLARFNDFHAANRFTSACSTAIYRDVLLGDAVYGNSFTCEPVHNLVSRLVLEPAGVSFQAHRAADEQQSEFLASTDNWFRPTMVRTGPDGGLYVSDMYRFVIEHPTWIPAEYQRKLDLRAGEDRGRIYCIVPADDSCCGAATATEDLRAWLAVPAEQVPVTDLVQRIGSPNGWWRDTAQRLLLHKNASAATTDLLALAQDAKSPAVRVQALSTAALLANGAQQEQRVYQQLLRFSSDESAHVRRQVIRLLEPWLRQNKTELPAAILQLVDDADLRVVQQLAYSLGESATPQAAAALAEILSQHADNSYVVAAAFSSVNQKNITDVISGYAAAATGQDPPELFGRLIGQAAALGQIQAVIPAFTKLLTRFRQNESADAAAWRALTEVTEQIGRHAAMKQSLRDSQEIATLWTVADQRAAELSLDQSADPQLRLAALQYLASGQPVSDSTAKSLKDLLRPTTAADLQQAVLETLSNREGDLLVVDIVERWQQMTPGVRSTATAAMLRREVWVNRLLEYLADSRIQPADIDAVNRERLTQHRNPEIANKARKLFDTQTSSQRQLVVSDLQAAIEPLTGQADAGRAVFEKRCATCHRLQDLGKSVGADLAALKDRSTGALLTAILDPNRAVESKYLSYVAVTNAGLAVTGMLLNETGNSLTLLAADGKEHVVARTDLEELIASGRSLMPEGLEKDLTTQELADVIAFVQSAGTEWKQFAGNQPQTVTPNADGTLTLPATAAEIYGPNLIFEEPYQNIGWWQSSDDYAVWNLQVPRGGHWTVVFEYACDNGTAGNLIRLSTGTRMLTARVPGTETWDNYRTWTAGTVDLRSGPQQLTVTAPENPSRALIDLRAIHLIPPR